jgi:hypothetical protein
MITPIIKKVVFLRNIMIYKQCNFLASINKSKFRTDPKADFVVSIASYPKRAHLLPAVFEALNTQTVVPLKWILVLSEEEWPNLILPHYLNKLEKRGIEIVWVKNNTFAVKVIVPVITKYPNLGIITFDDELMYGKKVIEKLITKSKLHKKAIIGHVGKELIKINGALSMFNRTKNQASLNTNSIQVYFLKGSGTFYPPKSLDIKVTDNEAICNVVPGRGADLWLWAAAVANGTQQICLGSKTDRSLYFAIPETDKTKPKDTPGINVMENRFQMAIDYFGIREKLIATLPNQE